MSTTTITDVRRAAPSVRTSLRRDLGHLRRQVGYEQRSYWRNRGRSMFTFAFPLLYLVVFASLMKGQRADAAGGRIPYDDFLVPGILSFAVIMTTFSSIATSTAILRDQGVLKRMQGTPLPRWVYVAARVVSTFLVAVLQTVLVIAGGAILWGLHLRAGAVPEIGLALLLGSAAFTTLGIGCVRFLKSAESAPMLANLAVLPLTFISDIWYQGDSLPGVVRTIADVFPVKNIAVAFQYAFNPHHHGVGLDGHALLNLAAWTVIGTWLMVRFLRSPLGDVKA
jgi:ABC-2 type transport system permease protein